jgi:hypothetical protein
MNDTTTRDSQESDIHITYLSETHKAFIENSAKVTGFLLLAIGWYATSTEARSFLATTSGLAVLSAIAVLSAYALSVAASWVAYSGSAMTYRRLQQLAYLPEEAYKERRLGLLTFAVCAAGNGVLACLLAYLLAATRQP